MCQILVFSMNAIVFYGGEVFVYHAFELQEYELCILLFVCNGKAMIL